MNRAQFCHVVAIGLNEWLRRFAEDPTRFEHEFQTVRTFLDEQGGGRVPSHGLVGARYMTRLLDELAAGKAGSDPLYDAGSSDLWPSLTNPQDADVTCAMIDAISEGKPEPAQPSLAQKIKALLENMPRRRSSPETLGQLLVAAGWADFAEEVRAMEADGELIRDADQLLALP